MAEYRRGSHTLYDIEYHFVWVTKYRYQVLRAEVAGEGARTHQQSCMSRDIKILKGHVSKDHIHLLVSHVTPSLLSAKVNQFPSRGAPHENTRQDRVSTG